MPVLSSPYLLRAEFAPSVKLDFDHYPLNIPAVRDIEHFDFHPRVTFFVGDNGSGKSTVLEAIAMALGFSPEGGTKNVRLRTTEISTSNLHESLRLIKNFLTPKDYYFLRAESFYNLATYMDDVGYVNEYRGSLHKRSHGESFMAVLLHKLRGHGLYLLDEPESALSSNKQMAALSALHHLVNDNSQFIIATHSPILLSYPDADIWKFDSGGISKINYEDSDAFFLTKDFLSNYKKRVKDLMS